MWDWVGDVLGTAGGTELEMCWGQQVGLFWR